MDDAGTHDRREYAQPAPAYPTLGVTVICALCGAHYIDDDDGREAHRVVFSHRPKSRTDADHG